MMYAYRSKILCYLYCKFIRFQLMGLSEWSNLPTETQSWNSTLSKTWNLIETITNLVENQPRVDPNLETSLNLSAFVPVLETLLTKQIDEM